MVASLGSHHDPPAHSRLDVFVVLQDHTSTCRHLSQNHISCSKARPAALGKTCLSSASSSSPGKQVGKGFSTQEQEEKGSRLCVCVAFKSPTQLTFDRSSILFGRSVRSLLPAALSCESKTTDGQGARTVLIRSRKSMTQVLQNLCATL